MISGIGGMGGFDPTAMAARIFKQLDADEDPVPILVG